MRRTLVRLRVRANPNPNPNPNPNSNPNPNPNPNPNQNELINAVTENQVLVVIGETGSGKTTQMTQYMVTPTLEPQP